jgi:selenocysteine lyase/cysteine desulfurase
VVTPIVHAEFSGLRITPSVYTTRDELAVFVDAMRMAMRRGIA